MSEPRRIPIYVEWDEDTRELVAYVPNFRSLVARGRTVGEALRGLAAVYEGFVATQVAVETEVVWK